MYIENEHTSDNLASAARQAREMAAQCRGRRAKGRFDLSLRTELQMMDLAASVRGTWAEVAINTHLHKLREELNEIAAKARRDEEAAKFDELEREIADLRRELVELGFGNG